MFIVGGGPEHDWGYYMAYRVIEAYLLNPRHTRHANSHSKTTAKSFIVEGSKVENK